MRKNDENVTLAFTSTRQQNSKGSKVADIGWNQQYARRDIE